MVLARPPVLVPHAAAAASHPLATEAALRAMRLGGSAADAVVAAGAVLCVVEPWASHLGGDGFGIVWDAPAARAAAVQGSGAAPSACDPAAFEATGAIPVRDARSVTVPGMVAAWFHLLASRGRLPAAEVFAPAIALAEEGFPAGPPWERIGRLDRTVIEADPGLAAILRPGGRPVATGDRVRVPDLAATLRGLARDGAALLYEGDLGARVCAEVQARGGWLAAEDLRVHRTEEIDPVAVPLAGGLRLLEQPLPSQGILVALGAALLDETDRRGWRIEGDGARAVARETHLQVEAYRLARAWRQDVLGDPRLLDEGPRRAYEEALAARNVAALAGRIDVERAAGAVPPARSASRETTYLCAADADGNVVSWIQSVFHHFGAGFVVTGTGVILNNRMCGFSLDPASPNRVAAGKRPVHTLNAWMVLRDGRPWLAGGTPGAERQVTTNLQILRGRTARGLDFAAALQAPRWMLDDKDRLALEARFPREVRRRLVRRGHEVVRIGPWEGSGTVQGIERLADGAGWIACTDPRGHGLAAGY